MRIYSNLTLFRPRHFRIGVAVPKNSICSDFHGFRWVPTPSQFAPTAPSWITPIIVV